MLDDIAHEADYLLRTARSEIAEHQPTAETMQALVAHAERAGQWARVGLDTGTAERQTRVLEVHAAALTGVIRRVLGRLQLTSAQLELVPVVVPEEIERIGIEGGSGE